MIRSNYTEKIKVLNQIYFLFLNLYIDFKKNRINSSDNFRNLENNYESINNKKKQTVVSV